MIPSRIGNKISALRTILRRLILLAGVSRVLLVALGLAAFCLLVDWTFHLSAWWRLAFAAGSLAGTSAATYVFLLRPMRVPMPDDQLALLFERRFPELSDVLVSAIQLAGGGAPASRDMIEAVIRDAEARSERLQPDVVPRPKRIRRLALCAGAALALALACGLWAPMSAHVFAARFLNPFGPAQWPRDTQLLVEVSGAAVQEGSEIAAASGEDVSVKVSAVNARGSRLWKAPRIVRLDYRYAQGSADSVQMRRAAGNVYQTHFGELLGDLTLTARASGARPVTVRIRAVQMPRVEEVWLSFTYPDYTRLAPEGPSQSLTQVRALAGTTVKVQIKANKTLANDGARLVTDPAGRVPMHRATSPVARDATHEGNLTLRKGMRWFRVELVDTQGLTNRNPRTFQLQVLEDKPPRVRILEPGRQVRCTPYALVRLKADVRDDLALSSAWLSYAPGPKEARQVKPFKLASEPPREAVLDFEWDISELGVKVGQSISYRAEAADFCDVFPPGSTQKQQVGRSDEYYIRIVSAADLASELDQKLYALRDQVKRAKRRQEADRLKIGELLRKMSEGQPMANADRAAASDAENVQRELARALTRVATEVARVRQRMQDNRIGSFADRRRLEDTGNTLTKVADRDVPRAAQFIKAARKDLPSRDGRDNLRSASGIQAEIIKQLAKVIARMSHNEDIDNLVRAARKLLRGQRRIKKETGDFFRRGTFGIAPTQLKPADLAALNLLVRSQKAAKDDMRNLEQDMLNVFERLKSGDPKRAELVRQAQVQASRDQIRPLMEDASSALAANKIGDAAGKQDAAIKGLARLLEMLENAREQSGSDELLQQAINDVKSALEQVGRLLKEQQGHVGDAAEINKDVAQARRLKQLRRELRRLRAEQDKMNAAAKGAEDVKKLAGAEDKLAGEADRVSRQLGNESSEAAKRRAPQSDALAKASRAASDAKAEMSGAKSKMQKGDADQAGRSGKQASDRLQEAERQIARALDAMEKSRLAQARETALKQRETSTQADTVFRNLKQLAKENENTSQAAAKGLNEAGDQVGEAQKSMKSAHSRLDQNDTVQGEKDATKARDRLAEAQDRLKKLRDQLERQQKEQKLLDLIAELQPMLERQITINDETLRIDGETAAEKLAEPARPNQVRLGQLAADESSLASKARDLLKKVEGENAPVFVWGFQKLIKDLQEAKDRLAQFKTDAYTQDVEKDIADTLRMLIDALKREQRRTRQGGGGGGGGGGGKPMLVPPSAQLKLLKARELEIHTKTKRIELKRLMRPGKPPSGLEKRRVKRLADEQAKLADLTTKLAEALEREVQENLKRQNDQNEMEIE